LAVPDTGKKQEQLDQQTISNADQALTTNQGLLVNDDQNTLKAGDRGPSLLEDFIFREKITHFDHERIPERIVHARGAAAHGHFQVYKSMAKYTKAKFLQDPAVKTPVFVRFSTVAGSRGSTDLARDVRGFAVKFYTEEGNYDLVGNNIPIFFIQDALKFPDLIHAAKAEPHNEIPQAATAHDTFWDFISLMPESMHMIMWAMSDRAIPRSFRMMEGFGIHTFRFVNAKGQSTFVKFHWKPLLGLHSVAWDEAQKISGKDADFHRRDLWEAIESGAFPEWEFGVQLVPEEDEHKFPFDLLDPTKIIPEELIPVQRIGKMTLNRNPANDPLLQGRLFSYTDTQLIRLGGPNFHEIPINRPVAPIHNNQRDGFMRQDINSGRVSYQPNSLSGGCPYQAAMKDGGFTSFPQPINAPKLRDRSESFFDFFSQATLFYNSQAPHEKAHIVKALRFELGKVETPAIRQRMVGLLTQVDAGLARQVAEGLGLPIPKVPEQPINQGVPADADQKKYQGNRKARSIDNSPALSMVNSPGLPLTTRKFAFLVADGADSTTIDPVKKALEAEGAMVKLIAPHLGELTTAAGKKLPIDFSLLTAASVLFDGVYIPGGAKSVEALLQEPDAIHFINETYTHCKPIGAWKEGVQLVKASYVAAIKDPVGVVTETGNSFVKTFVKVAGTGRFWEREAKGKVPA